MRKAARNGKTSWVRATVTWTPSIDLLLEHGYLVQDPAPSAPVVPPRAERLRQWRAKRRVQRPALPEGQLTVAQAAEALGLSVDAVRGAIKCGTLTTIRLPARPGRQLISTGEIDRYRQEHLGRRGRRPQP